MKILLIGSSGYVGNNIYRRYKDFPVNFIVPGKRSFGECIRFELCDYDTDLPPAHNLSIEDIRKYDGIIHLAALSGIAACENDHIKAVRDNVLAAQNIFKLASECRIPVIFTSSQAACSPNSSIYAGMKFTIEKMADYYNIVENGCIYIVRLANLYGGFDYLEKKNTVVKQFITAYQNNQPLVIHGKGEQKRDFINVLDVSEAIMKLLIIKPDYFSPIDIGTGIGTSVLDLAKMFENSTLTFLEDSGMIGVESNIADPTKAKELLNFEPRIKIDEYIKETTQYKEKILKEGE